MARHSELSTGAARTGDTVRVFIALHISQEARQALEATVQRLQASVPSGVRWVDPASIHLTLKFLGNIDSALLDPIFEAMGRSARDTRPFYIQLSRLGMFPNERQPRVLWAGVGGDLDSLGALQARVDAAVAELGFEPEKRPFNPHLTLGRVRDGVANSVRRRIGSVMASAALEPTAPWLVESVHLMKSTLTPSGALYTSLGSEPLWKK